MGNLPRARSWMFKQGGMFSSWKRRLCVLVPTSLLFYFEDEEADSPSGVVVIDSHTDVASLREEYDGKKFVVRVAPHVKGVETRHYYFQVRTPWPDVSCRKRLRWPCSRRCLKQLAAAVAVWCCGRVPAGEQRVQCECVGGCADDASVREHGTAELDPEARRRYDPSCVRLPRLKHSHLMPPTNPLLLGRPNA